MFSLKKIPKELLNLLSSYQTAEADVLFAAFSDLTLDCAYADCYIFLTKSGLLLAQTEADGTPRVFAGYGDKEAPKGERSWGLRVIPLSELDKLEIQSLVTGGVLYTAGKENRQLAAFTNTRMGEFRRLCRLFEKVKKGEELTEEDYREEHPRECCPKCGSPYPEQGRKVCPKCMDRRSIFMRVLSYFKPHWLKITVMLFCILATAGLNLVWPYLNGAVLYDKVLGRNEAFLQLIGLPAGRFAAALLGVVVTMAVTKLLLQLLGIISGVFTAQIVPEVVKDLKSQVFDSMGRLSISFYNNRQTGGLMVRVLNDADQVTGFFIDQLPYFLINILTVSATVMVMVRINWKMALASLLLLPLLILISYKMLPRVWNAYGRRHRASRSLNAQINDNITGARVVKAFGQEEGELRRFDKYNVRVRDAEMGIVKNDNWYNSLYVAVQNITYAIIWGLGAYLVLESGYMELGMLITFAGYVSQLNGPLDFMSFFFRSFAESINAAQRIFEIVDASPDVVEKQDPVRLEQVEGHIKLEQVTFGYEPHKPVLRDVTLEVEPGKMLGIVGRSGAGKSTLVNLISRLYDPDEGLITLDGVDVRDLAFDDLRRSVAMVSQETYIFMGTVAQNIAYANPAASRQDVMAAAVAASAHDFICKMPDGYDTVIGSAGRQLSGGERQRISIARAILANPRILILDEATASVDTETEQAIQASLDKLVKGRTTLSIAHRLSTLKNADSLVVIDDGRITESGTHAQLIEKKGTYYKLMELQSKALAMRGLE